MKPTDQPTAADIQADPDRILTLVDRCPECGSADLEALTWQSRGLPDVTFGCWTCGFIMEPAQADQGAIAAANQSPI
jgi:rubredoxin